MSSTERWAVLVALGIFAVVSVAFAVPAASRPTSDVERDGRLLITGLCLAVTAAAGFYRIWTDRPR